MRRTKREPRLTDWKLHLHRYGGRAMCGRGIGAETQDVTDDESTFNASDRQCKSCRRAQDADDAKEMARERALDEKAALAAAVAPPSIGEIAETSGGWEAQNEAHRRAVE